MKKRGWLRALAAGLLSAGLLMGTLVTGADEAVEEETEQERLDAPVLSHVDQYGVVQTLSDYKGKVVFLNFWATWCPPCREEMPAIQSLYEKYKDSEDVAILAVAFPTQSGEGTAEQVAAFLEENGYTYPTLMDEEGTAMWTYGVTAFPTTYMIDREGKVYGYVTGALTKDLMEEIIQQTLDASQPEPETETEADTEALVDLGVAGALAQLSGCCGPSPASAPARDGQ